MKKWLAYLSAGCMLLVLPLRGEESAPADAKTEEKATIAPVVDQGMISEALGHLLFESLKNLGAELDNDRVLLGLKNAMKGDKNPLTEEQAIEAIQGIREKHFEKVAKDNLRQAEEFLDFNAKNANVTSLESGKIQYVVLQKGEGAIVEEHTNPMIKYQGRYLNGQVFGESTAGEVVPIDEAFPGISKALVGMKEGEKRTIYIHPDFAFGTQGFMQPNSLLTFDIEVVKAHVPEEKLDLPKDLADISEISAESIQ